jgi:hypothetical protein
MGPVEEASVLDPSGDTIPPPTGIGSVEEAPALDVVTAFLNPAIDKEVFMQLPEGIEWLIDESLPPSSTHNLYAETYSVSTALGNSQHVSTALVNSHRVSTTLGDSSQR